MRKSGLLILIAAIFILSACAVQPVPTAVPVPTNLPATATATLPPIPSTTPTDMATPAPTTVILPSGPATCSVISAVPTVDPTAEAYLPTVSKSDWKTGPDSAAITIIEYGDFQDKTSAQLYTILSQLLSKYPEDVSLVFRHFPLTEQLDKDQLAAQAAEAAGEQGKFWEFAKLLYSGQSDWTGKTSDDFTAWADEKAAGLGLNEDQFKATMLADVTIKKVTDSRNESKVLMAAGMVNSDPFLFINGYPIYAPYSLDILSSKIDYFKLSQRAFTACPPMTVDPAKEYTATLHTEKGDIVLDLYADKAPWAVNSFVYLAEQGWYNGSGFYRVIPGFLVQAGDPSNSGLGNPGYTFTDELTPELRFDKPGVVGMANDGPDSNGSQFFITYAAAPSLDGKYTVFGQVTSGMDVLSTLRPRNPASDAILLTPDPIVSISIEVK